MLLQRHMGMYAGNNNYCISSACSSIHSNMLANNAMSCIYSYNYLSFWLKWLLHYSNLYYIMYRYVIFQSTRTVWGAVQLHYLSQDRHLVPGLFDVCSCVWPESLRWLCTGSCQWKDTLPKETVSCLHTCITWHEIFIIYNTHGNVSWSCL